MSGFECFCIGAMVGAFIAYSVVLFATPKRGNRGLPQRSKPYPPPPKIRDRDLECSV